MLNNTVQYVATNKISFVALFGSDKTNAKDKPPRKPPQEIIRASFLFKLKNLGKKLNGKYTKNALVSKTIKTETIPKTTYSVLKST